jgi:hypothetical protein
MVIVEQQRLDRCYEWKGYVSTRWLLDALPKGGIGLTTLILSEVLRGFRYDREFRRTRNMLLALPALRDCR